MQKQAPYQQMNEKDSGVSCEAQRYALDEMSRGLLLKLQEMEKEQSRRAAELADYQHSLSPTPLPPLEEHPQQPLPVPRFAEIAAARPSNRPSLPPVPATLPDVPAEHDADERRKYSAPNRDVDDRPPLPTSLPRVPKKEEEKKKQLGGTPIIIIIIAFILLARACS